jgi:hypothetical protein
VTLRLWRVSRPASTSAIAVAIAATVMLMLAPGDAEAQRRGGRPRVVRPATRVVISGGYIRPSRYYWPSFYYGRFYDPWYSGFGYGYSQWPYYGYGGRYDSSASVRIQASPRETEVFVDGYYAGRVDDFDGTFQRLHLEPGEHELQLYLPGHRAFNQKIYLQPTGTFRVRHDMQPLGAGEAPPARPDGPPLSDRTPSAGTASDRDDRDSDRPAGVRPTPRPGTARERDRERRGPVGDTYGAVALRVQPQDAEVFIDGERWDGTPDARLVVQLEPGSHQVEIRKSGYRTYLTEITVRRGETVDLNVSMTAR